MLPKTALKTVLTEIITKYLAAHEKGLWNDRHYEMGRAHGALWLMQEMGHDNNEGWQMWGDAFDSVSREVLDGTLRTEVPAQEVGVG